MKFQQSPDDKALYTLHTALEAGPIESIEKILNRWNFTGKELEESLVFWRGDSRVLMLMFAHGLSPNAVTPQGVRPLIIFSRETPIKVESIRKLVQAGADVTLPDIYGTQPLIWLCGKADTEHLAMTDRPYCYSDFKLAQVDSLIQAMLEAGADPNAADAGGSAALYYAAQYRSAATVGRLLEADADPNRPGGQGHLPLHKAVSRPESIAVEICSQLLRHGSAPSPSTNQGYTPLGQALANDRDRVAAFLAAHGALPSAADLTLVALFGGMGGIRTILRLGLSVNTADTQGDTALIMAARRGNTDMVRELLALGANVHSVNLSGFSPLSFAVMGGNMDIVDMLIKAGAKPSEPDRYGRTAFDLAAQAHRSEMMQRFRSQHKASRPPGGYTPLMLAMEKAQYTTDPEPAVETVRCLLERGADVNAVNSENENALMLLLGVRDCTYSRQHSDAIDALAKLLIDAGADVNLTNRQGFTALHAAAKYGYFKAAKSLLNAGAVAKVKDIHGKTPFDYARDNRHSSLVALLSTVT